MSATPDQMLAEFSRHVERVTGWGMPSFDGVPKTPTEALALMRKEIVHLDEAWGDMRNSLEKKATEIAARTP